MFRGFIGVVLTVLVLGVSFAASASGFDLFGVQAQGIAEVSARTAAARDGSASYYNPGGLALGQGYEVDLSALGVMSQLEVQDRSYAIDEPWGATVTVAAAVLTHVSGRPLSFLSYTENATVNAGKVLPLIEGVAVISPTTGSPVFKTRAFTTSKVEFVP
ncbi:MAG TPA: hypothetical protein PKL73_11640 [Polyangiaceae bacterium]|nr:hypothetical protein [Polyangiaceae bacterium]